MKKQIFFLFTIIMIVLSATGVSFAATGESVIVKSQLKDFAGKTAVVTANTQLNNAYSFTGTSESILESFIPLNYAINLKKGDIVIVLDESGANYRVRIPATGDLTIVSGFISKNFDLCNRN